LNGEEEKEIIITVACNLLEILVIGATVRGGGIRIRHRHDAPLSLLTLPP